MYDAGTRAKARTIAEARGLSAAATVTGIGISTLKRWAAAEGWQAAHSRKPPPPADTPSVGPVAAAAKGNAAHSPTRDPARDLQADADLAREVFRQQGQAVLDGHGRPSWFRDSAVSWGIAMDKRHQYGAPAGGGWPAGKQFTWAEYFADQERRKARLLELLEIAERRMGNGDG